MYNRHIHLQSISNHNSFLYSTTFHYRDYMALRGFRLSPVHVGPHRQHQGGQHHHCLQHQSPHYLAHPRFHDPVAPFVTLQDFVAGYSVVCGEIGARPIPSPCRRPPPAPGRSAPPPPATPGSTLPCSSTSS